MKTEQRVVAMTSDPSGINTYLEKGWRIVQVHDSSAGNRFWLVERDKVKQSTKKGVKS